MNIAIVGAGIAGLTTAIALNKKDIKTTIFEANPEIKELGAGLGLAANAIKAFEYLGLKEELLTICNPINNFLIIDHKGQRISTTKTEGSYTIHRAQLQGFLLNNTDSTTIYLDKKLKDISWNLNNITLHFFDGSCDNFDYVIIADGIHSLIRKKLLPSSMPRYAGYTCWRAVIENCDLKITEASETWGSKGRFGIVPLKGNKTYWFACINAKEKEDAYRNFTIENLQRQFQNYHEPISTILNQSKNEDLIHNDIYDLAPIEQFSFGKIILIGDAAHATTPNMGQGACQAIEDAVVLSQCMKEDKDYEIAFKKFEQLRLKRTHWIVNTSWQIGKIAQIENKHLIKLRNMIFRVLPHAIGNKQQQRLTSIDFNNLKE